MSAEVERSELAPGLSISRLVTGFWQVADMEPGSHADGGSGVRERSWSSAVSGH